MVTGAVQETTRLLENKFDYIFFTGTSHGTEQSPAWILCEEEDVFPPDIPAKKAGIGLGMCARISWRIWDAYLRSGKTQCHIPEPCDGWWDSHLNPCFPCLQAAPQWGGL